MQSPQKIEETALNGAQIAQLTSVASQVAQGLLPLAAARAIAEASFPGIPPEKISAIFDSLVEGGAADPEPTEDAPEPPLPVKAADPDLSTKVAAWTHIAYDPWGDHDCGTCHKAADIPEGNNADVSDIESLAGKLEQYHTDLVRDFMGDPTLDATAREKELATLIEADLEKVLAEAAFEGAGVRGSPETIEEAGKSDVFNRVNERALEAAKRQTIELAGDITQTTMDQLKAALARGIEDGQSTRQIADAIVESGFPRTRANAIARTEMARAQNSGRTEGLRALYGDEVRKHVDLAPNACALCRGMFAATNGLEGVPITEAFWAAAT